MMSEKEKEQVKKPDDKSDLTKLLIVLTVLEIIEKLIDLITRLLQLLSNKISGAKASQTC